jgi:hypothetical protein
LVQSAEWWAAAIVALPITQRWPFGAFSPARCCVDCGLTMPRRITMFAVLFAACSSGVAGEQTWARPSTAFVQLGGSAHTRTLVAGATYDIPWQREFSWGRASAFVEVSFGRWISHTGDGTGAAWTTQLGFTPVLRVHPDGWGGWFAEAGVGANWLAPVFRSEGKRFSTVFNFGDHVALGRRFGDNEIALRLQHFSNAGLSEPNPGENFVQVRYSRRW